MTRQIRPRLLSEIQPLSAESAARVRQGLAKIPGDHAVFAARFYEILFRIAPHARMLFPEDMTLQTERFAKGLLAAVRAAAEGQHERVIPALQNWGVRHRIQYKVTDDQYVYVCHALVKAVMELTDATDTHAASAWTEVYQWLAAVMIDGADAFDITQLIADLEPDIQPHEEPIAATGDGSEQVSPAAASIHRRHRRDNTWFTRPVRTNGD